jgi:hypothetical protein
MKACAVLLLLTNIPPRMCKQEAKASATDAGLFTVPAAFAHALLSLLGPATAALMTAAAAAAGTWYVAAGGFGSSKRRHKRVAPLKEVQEEADEPGGCWLAVRCAAVLYSRCTQCVV